MTSATDLEALTAELQRLRADLAKVAKATETLVRNAGEDAVEMGEQTWKTARNRVEREIEEQPLRAAAIALGIGVVVGLFVSHRR